MQKIIIKIIQFYQFFISPMLGQNCRYIPTCSEYSIEAIKTHGTVKGVFLASKRICTCQPFCKGGHDPVPNK